MNKLADEIARHIDAYAAGEPEVTDAAFDALIEEMRRLDPRHPILYRVGRTGEVAHVAPMLSLEKTKTWADIAALGPAVATPKLDGVALAVTYFQGKFVRATTRGDGIQGEDATAFARSVVPPRLHRAIDVEVRGEAILTTNVQVETNRRNVVAGLVARGGQHLEAMFIAYDAPGWDARKTYPGLLGDLVLLGFAVPPFEHVGTDVPKFDVPFDTDGVVVTVLDLARRIILGETSHHPRWALAWKPTDAPATTIVKGLEWQVGRTGTLTPVVVVADVELAGVNVTRATLHNVDRFRTLNLGMGDEVEMTRRGSVIPHVERVVARHADVPFEVPLSCPVCGAAVENARCSRPRRCPGVLAAKVEHFAKVIGVDGIGPEVAAYLVDRGLRDVFGLYFLAPAAWPTSGEKMTRAMKAKATMDLATFIEALGIEGVGRTTSRLVAEVFGDVNDVLAASVEDFEKIAGIGPTTALALAEGLDHPDVGRLLMVVTVKASISAPEPLGALRGQTLCFTGELARWSRTHAETLARAQGAKTTSSVSKKTTMLVVGAAPGKTKMDAAAKYGTKIVDEATFEALLGPVEGAPKTAVDLTRR